ncbi:MAG TPA: hypothetical protein VNK67_05840 [Burkholderiales bacterium]|nr:hypothetical protein [Burkholderiales bacterium]
MAAKKPADDPQTDVQQTPQQTEQPPASGGSYVRLPDGTLVPAQDPPKTEE